ncbi:hypothetical protein E2C01_098295 [Portunus trituberculatus]|uniref:Uncharacterized protein n=1 Tax=Portunus trituberculatus TaxID=210409 RepID=A0A5B7KCJ6_PORTR|nr:hypothetical protein [Portunus trituberculatus]
MPYLYQYPSSQYLNERMTVLTGPLLDCTLTCIAGAMISQLSNSQRLQLVSLVAMAELLTQMSVHLSAQLCPAYEYI